MKLFRYRSGGLSKPGVLINEKHIDVSSYIKDYDGDFFESRQMEKLKSLYSEGELEKGQTIENVDFDSPIYRPGKIICVGLNYLKHAKESGMSVPEEPVLFFKASSSIVGPFDDIIIPKNSKKTDWEVELAVIIGKKARYVDENEALNCIAGYTIHNDVSEREFQLERGGQWVKGKSCDTFAPLGPYLVTDDEIDNPNSLNLWLKRNGEIQQNGSTSDFIFNIQQVISYISQFMSLEPGDVISTGTPEGVGFGFDPPVYLKPGDVLELGIEGLGQSKQVVQSYKGL